MSRQSSFLQGIFRNNHAHSKGTQTLTRKRSRGITLEPLEPRLLLSAETMAFLADAAHSDLSVRIDNSLAQIVDDTTGSILLSRALEDTLGIVITGSEEDDSLTIDESASLMPIAFDGGEGVDTLFGPSANSTWNVTGDGVGSVGNVTFASLESLIGAADNLDLFIFEQNGSLAKGVEGGAGGFDSIQLEGAFDEMTFTITGADSGIIERDGDLLSYAGFEPVINNAATATVTVAGTAGADKIRIGDRGTTSDSDFVVSFVVGEDQIFTNVATTGLIVNAGAGDDEISIIFPDFGLVNIEINGEGGNDEIFLPFMSSLVTYDLDGGADQDTLRIRTDELTLTDVSLTNGVGTTTLAGFERAIVFGDGGLDATGFTGQVLNIADTPEWAEEGPNPFSQILDGATAPWDPVSGAINSIAVDPNDRFTIYLGTVNGGVWRNTGSKEVFFAEADSTVDGGADTTTLNAFADFLEAHPSLTVEIGGHTDSQGDPTANLTLSQTRATNVRNFLVNTRHIEASRLTTVGYGEDRPVADNGAGGDQPLNRRVELQVQNWEPLTDNFPSLSISSVAVSPLSSQVIYAGIGRTSSFASAGGFQTGLLVSVDGGAHWRVLAAERLSGLTVTKVLPTTLTSAGKQIVFVSTFDVDRNNDGNLDDKGGLFRIVMEADGTAASIEKLSGAGDVVTTLPAGHYTDLAFDGTTNEVYAANPGDLNNPGLGSGIFQAADGAGLVWAAVNNGFQFGTDTDADTNDDLLQSATRIKFGIHPGTGSLWAGVLGPVDASGIFNLTAGTGVGLIGLFFTDDDGANWAPIAVPTSVDGAAPGTTFGLHPGGQGDTHFSIAVDPTDEHVVYVGGDAQGTTTANSVGLTNAGSGRLFALTSFVLNTWTQIVGTGANATAPHADSRGMVFTSDFTLLEIDDGGLSRLQNPFGAADQGTRQWTSANGDLRISEVLRLAYDSVNDDIIVGLQDNGSSHQDAGDTDGINNDHDGADGNADGIVDFTEGTIDEADENRFWSGTGGDGNSQATIPIDMTGDLVTDRVLRYSLHNNFNFLQVYEYTTAGVLIDAAGNPANTFQTIGLRTPGNATNFSALNAQDAALSFDVIPMVVNTINPLRMLIAYNGIYESVNTNITGVGPARILPLDEVQQIDPAVGVAVAAGNEVTALIYGGTTGGVPNAELVIASRANNIQVRQVAGGAFTTRVVTGAGPIRDIAVDPDNWKVVYVADATDVYRIADVTNAASPWVKITGNLRSIAQTDLRTLEYVEAGTGDMLLVGGIGGVSRLRNPDLAPAGVDQWMRLGLHLPNVPVFDIEWIDDDNDGVLSLPDVLLAGTLGRGVWSLTATQIGNFAQNSVLSILGKDAASPAGDDHFLLIKDTQNPLLFNLFDTDQSTTVPIFTGRGSTFDQIIIDTRGGDDTLTVDHSNGGVYIPRGIAFDGGGGGETNTVILQGGAFTSHTTTPPPPTLIHDIVDLNNLRQRVLVEDATVNTAALPNPLDFVFDTLKGAFNALVDFLTLSEQLSENVPLFASSLGRALNGVPVEEPAPLLSPSDGGDEEEEEEEEGSPAQSEKVVRASGEAVDLLRRFIETGTGAFKIEDIKNFTTLAQLVTALEGLDESSTGTVTSSGTLAGGFEITLSGVRKNLEGRADVSLDLLNGAVHIEGLVDVSADVTLNLTFGLNNALGFYIKEGLGHEIVISNIVVPNAEDIDATGRFGFLGVEMTEADLSMDSDVRFEIDIDESGGDGNILLMDLISTPAAYITAVLHGDPSNVDVTLVGTFEVSALIPGVEAPFDLFDARATITWDDIDAADLNGTANAHINPTIGSTSAGALLSFLEFGTQDFLDQLTELKNQLDAIFGDTEIPFLSDSLTDLVGYVTFFQQQILTPLSNGLSGLGVPTIQSLVTILANKIGTALDEFGLSYDSGSTELTFHLVVDKTIVNATKSLGAGVDLLDGLADVQFSTTATVGATVTLDTVFGVDIGALLTGVGSPLDWFFLRDPSLSVTASIEAEDVEASARFGFLSIGIDEGELSAPDLSLTVSLNDPGANAADGRIDLSELDDGLADFGDFVSITGGGSIELTLPVETSFLPGLPDIPDGTDITTLTNRSIVVTIPDLSDPTTIDVTLGSALTHVGNFGNIDAASLVSLLGQLTFWLDEFRRSDEFANFDLPIVGPALDQVLGFADEFRDKVLLDDKDTGLDSDKTLLFDLNKALDGAGLGRLIYATLEGGNITFVGLDADVTTFTVTGATALGFSPSQGGSIPVSEFFAKAKAANPFGDAEGNLASDVTFTITIGTKAYEVKVKASDTTANTTIGDDRWKLVNGQNAATFATAQEMAIRLLDAFGVGYPGLVYNTVDQTLTFTVDLSGVFGTLDLPFGFSLDELDEFLKIQTSGKLRLQVSGELNLTLGVFLGPAEPSDKLTVSTLLSDLTEPVVISTEQRIVAPNPVRTVYGQLSDDATFTLNVTGDVTITTPLLITVTKAATANNVNPADLVSDINAALGTAGLTNKIQAVLKDLRIELVKAPAAALTGFKLTTTNTDSAVKDIGFASSQTAAVDPADSKLKLTTTKDLAALRGRLTGDASFTVSLNNVNAGAPLTITVLAANTETNRFAFDIVNDINASFAGHPEWFYDADPGPGVDTKPRIEVGFSDGKLTFAAKGGATTFTLGGLTGTAASQLGLAPATGNSDDLIITLRNGTVHRVNLDGSTTIGQIIDKIEDATGDLVDVTINERGSGLTLEDLSPSGVTEFKVQITNNSTAGLSLGIVREDAGEGETPDHFIEGADIAALTPLDRFFIQATPGPGDPLAGLSVELGTPLPLTASAQFGFVGLQLEGHGALGLPDNNALEASLTLRLNEPAGSTDGRVSLAELIDSLDDIGELFDLSLTGNAAFDLTLSAPTIAQLAADLGIDVGGNPRIHVTASLGDVFADTPVPPTFDITYEGFNELLDFGNVEFNFQSIIAGLRLLNDFLGQFEAFDFLDEPLPVVGISVSELIDVADKFGDAVDEARNNPAGTVQVLEDKLKQAFGLAPSSTLINLTLVNDNNGTPGTPGDDFRILRFDLNVGAAFSESVGIDFDLGLPIDLGGGGDLTAAGSVNLSLSIGFDISDPTKIYLFNSTGLEATLDLTGTDLSFRAAVGPLGVFIDGGTVDIGGTLLPGNKFFRANFDDLSFINNRVLIDFDDFGALFDGFTAELAGAIAVALPVYFPTESIFAGTVLFDASLSLLDGEFDFDADPRAEDENGDDIDLAELFAFDPGELSLLDQLILGVDGMDLFLEGLQDILDGEIGGVQLPLIGDKLAGAADGIADFRSGFVEKFRKGIEDLANPAAAFEGATGADPVSKLLFNLLGEPGINLLKDTNNNSISDVGDITFKTNFDDPDTEPGDLYFDWDFKLGKSLDKSAGIDFDIGIPGLGLETTGAVQFTLGWELALGFGLNFDDGFYFDIGDDADEADDDATELELFVDVSIPGGGIKGTLGFLQLEAEDDTDDTDGLTTHLSATFGIDIFNKSDDDDTKLGFSELGRISIDAGIAAEAVVDLGMKLSLSSDLVPSADTNFPSVVADFTLIWQVGDADEGDLISLSDLDGSFLKNGLQYVGFEHVGLDLGSYLSDLIGPIANTIQEITEPIKPFLDFITTPIPVISDLAGPTSLLDIAAMSGLINPGIIAAIEVIDQVVDIANLVNSLPSGNVVMYFDSFLPSLVIYGTPPGTSSLLSGPGIDLTNPNLDLKSLSETLLSNLDFLPEELQEALGGVVSDLAAGVGKMLPGGSASSGFSLPIIEDPSQIFGMLMGQPAVLVQYDMAPLELEAEFSAFFSIFGPLGVSINAEFSAQFGPFTFGYDTLGITEFAGSDFKNPLLLFDGFFVGDLDPEGNDVPELQFDAGLWAAAELNLGIARGGVGGGLFAEIDMDLHDPNDDGRVRIKEIVTNILNEFKYGEPALSPLAMFDITGKLTAELFAFLKIDFGFFEVDEKFLITDPIVLLDFESNFERFPTLATELPDGVLQLNMGKFSEQRIEGDLTDLPEEFHVKQDGAGHVKVWAPSLGVDESEAQDYDVTSLILALGGEGNDTIDLHLVTDNLKYELEGNAGDDVIKAGTGTGAAHILGGAGDDELWGSGGDDNIFGETGEDEIHGGGGKDWLFGDGDAKDSIQGTTITVTVKANDGNDDIFGDAGEDLIFGAGGLDEIHGGDDADVLIGDAGTVTVGGNRLVVTLRSTLVPPQTDTNRLELAVFDTSKTGKGAKDEMYGDGGNDRMYGGVGDDLLEGGADNDVIWGELGPDTINAGTGDDVVFGDFGTFSLFNGNLEPEATVGGENDVIHGDAGNDKLLGGAGKDEIHGDADSDTIFGGTGQDKLYGEGGADFLYGNADSDEMYGGTGGDYLEGGGGNDFVRGEGDNDLLVAGYGSDDLDGGEGSDTYRITARGGSLTDGSIAYDSGLTPTDTDILIMIGTDQADTVLLRAMADFYFPTKVKLIGDGSSKGLTDKIFESGEPDKLRSILQALEDAYGPHDIPTGLISQIIDLFVAAVKTGVENAISNEYVVDPDPDSTVPSLPDLLALLNHVDDPLDDEDHDGIFLTDSRSKLQEIQDSITKAYGRNTVPSTMFTEIINAWNNFGGGLKASIESAISTKYKSEALVGLHKIVQEESDSSKSDPDKLSAMIARITAAYAPGVVPAAMVTALTTAFTADPDDVDALKAAITANYNPLVPVPGIETDTGFIALINNNGANVERFNYRYMEGLVINTIGGDDYVVSDDVIGTTTINLGLGDDRVQIGQVFRSERVKDPGVELITGITAEDVFTTLEITRGWLSNGVSRATTVNGGDGNDQFTVFHNVAVLNLNGGDGDDIFTVRAFALKGSTDSERARTDMKGDGGADTILYVVNAPVGIDGGDGFDTVRIVGTEFADDFVVTDSGVFGAGLNVTYVNIEKLVADGAEGDDRYFVLSTGLEVITEIDGGLGSDTYFVGGNPSRSPIPVISNDFKGHSGIILHSVESTLGGSQWTGLPVEGISVNVGDNEEDFFILTESDGGTRVVEGSDNNLSGWEFDSYGIRLTQAPGFGQSVTINIVLAGMSPEDQAKGFRDLEFFAINSGDTLDGEPLGVALGFNELTDLPNLPSLTFTTGNWFIPQYVKFRAVDTANYSPDSIQLPNSPLTDQASEGKRFVFINHTAQNSTDPDYQSAQMLSVKVHMEDNDRDGVIITPVGRDNVVLEGGFTDDYSVVLAKAPSSPVTVTMNVLGDPDQISLSSYVLLFDNDDDGNAADGTVWSTPQNITVTGVDDAVVEGFHTDYIEFVVTSADVDQTLNVVNLQVDGDFDLLGVQPIPPAKPTSYVLLPNKPLLDQPITVSVGGVARPASRYSISGNTLSFIGTTGFSELVIGNVLVSYSYHEEGYDGSFVKDSVVDIYDNDTPTVIVEQFGDGSTDVIEGLFFGKTDHYRIRLSQAPAFGETVTVNIDSVDTRTTYGRTALFETQVNVAGQGDVIDGDFTLTKVTFDSSNWNLWKEVFVTAIDDLVFDGNDTQVFAPDLQTVNKIRGPLIIEGAAGAGSLSLPRALMLPHELNVLKPDGVVQSFVAGAGGGAEETMTVLKADLLLVIDRMQGEDSTIEDIDDLIGKTVEMSSGFGTGVILDPLRPEDLFDRFWLIKQVVVLIDGDLNPANDLVRLTLQNPTLVDPSKPNIIAPNNASKYAITSLSVNFFADEREQVDYLFVYDEDSVANDVGAFTSSDGAVFAFNAGTNVMTIETTALQAVAKLLNPNATDFSGLLGLKLEITVGPALGRAWTISTISVLDGPTAGTKLVTLTPVSGAGTPTNRSEFRIAGSDRYGRIIGFGMGPNVLFAERPQPGGITYGDIEVVQMTLGSGNDTVRVDYTTNSEDHTTKRSGDFYTLTTLDTGKGNDTITVNLVDGDDGAFALNLEAGNDTVNGGTSTLPMVIFGGDGNDTINSGSGADIIFGDIGRVDYIKTVNTDTNNDQVPDTLINQIITRLGHTVPQNPVNPPVTGATATTLSDDNTTFETAYGGLVGLSVQVISPQGHVQFRTIVANTAHTITVDRPWDQIPVFHNPLPDPVPDDNFFYRFSSRPDDQTDGIMRGPRVAWSINISTGGNDTVNGGGGQDIVIGGIGDDTIHGDAGHDLLAGDIARFDFVPVVGLDGPTNFSVVQTTDRLIGGIDTIYGDADDDILIGGTNSDNLDGGSERDLIFGDNVLLTFTAGSGNAIDPRFRALTGAVIYGADGLAQVAPEFAVGVNPVPGGRPAWGDFAITLDPSLAAAQFGNDYIAGGAGDDEIFGQLGNDVIQGDGSIATMTDGNPATLPVSAARVAGLLQVTPSFEAGTDGDDYIEGNGGNDVIFGNLGQDDIIGGNSNLFSLTTPTLRADGADLIFGGAGSDTVRNDVGDASNGRDADMIAGDNANIYRLVSAAAAYLNFNYDNAYAVQIIPRAAELLDYTPGGPDYNAAAAATNIGVADEIHGESGDDFIYGQVGGDALFGDGQNDVIIGGYGADWISGGTGDDGILGDDGRIFISRNSTTLAEPLYGIAAIAAGSINALVSVPTGDTTAITNVNGALKYTVDLTPFSVDPTNAAPTTLMPRALYANDMIFGGLGDDSLHGGAGEDAISGGEAMVLSYVNNYAQNGSIIGAPIESDFARPINPGNVLGYNPTTTKFALYDANDPLRKILLTAAGALSKTGTGLEWALNFTELDGPLDTAWIVGTTYPGKNTDGNDHVFGDLGHDWIVGGTGRDTLWGGWGDDLLQADDILSTAGGLNSGPDTNPSWEDFGYGGAGRDVLIGNTGGDRLWDFAGEFNTFVIPYNPFGIPTVQRVFQPSMEAFMLALSKSQGADQTLATQYGSSAARNGEPFGELGFVLQQDAAWNDQNGGPRDPQGPNSNAKQDVKTSAGVQPLFDTASGLDKLGSGEAQSINDSILAQVVSEARQLWSQELGAGDSRLGALNGVTIEVGNLPDLRLGVTIGGLVLIDSNAAGYGWSLNGTAGTNGQMDLLTVVMHEMGHILGFDHDGDGLMEDTLSAGQRKLEVSATGNPTTSASLFDYSEVSGNGKSSLAATALIDWTRKLTSTGLGWGPIGKRENGAGFPEFSLSGSDDRNNSKKTSAGHLKKRRFDLNEEVVVEPRDLPDWYIEV